MTSQLYKYIQIIRFLQIFERENERMEVEPNGGTILGAARLSSNDLTLPWTC